MRHSSPRAISVSDVNLSDEPTVPMVSTQSPDDAWHALADALPHAIWTQDADGAFDFANAAWRAYTRIASELMTLDDWAAIIAPDDYEQTVTTLLAALDDGAPFEAEVRIRPMDAGDDGYRWHLIRSTPVLVDGRVERWVGIATDVDLRRRTNDGLQVLSRASSLFLESLALATTLQSVATIVTESLADFCLVYETDEDGTVRPVAQSHRDPHAPVAIELLAEHLRQQPGYAPHPVLGVIASGRPVLVTRVDDAWIAANAASPEHGAFMRAMGHRSIIFVPIVAGERCLGALTLVRTSRVGGRGDMRHYDSLDVSFAEELGRRAGIAIENARRFERESRISAAFQRASLPTLPPRVGALAIDAFYRPGRDEATVGGDWYDAYELADGRIAITIGDVLGKGLGAAVTMARLRYAMQVASDADPDPNAMLAAADRALRREGSDAYATAIAAIYDAHAATLSFAVAGHPGPALRLSDGSVEVYERPGMLLGLWRNREAPDPHAIAMPAGATLVFYTDGLVEITRDIDTGTALLREAMARRGVLDQPLPAAALVDAVLAGRAPHDDIAVIVARPLERARNGANA